MRECMHAVVQQAFGGPEVLEVAEVDRPVPLATEVLVRVKAVGVNPVEPVIRSGQFPLIGPPPFILGWDISGVVEPHAEAAALPLAGLTAWQSPGRHRPARGRPAGADPRGGVGRLGGAPSTYGGWPGVRRGWC
jgi:NADPH:quinone reductase-like Zn-dependent oxidoreductase